MGLDGRRRRHQAPQHAEALSGQRAADVVRGEGCGLHALPAGASRPGSDRRSDRRAAIHRLRRSGKPSARTEGDIAVVPYVNAPDYKLAPPGDFVLAFDLPRAHIRGRLVRLDAVSARALEAHQLPEAASRLVAEASVLAALFGSALKLSGRLTVQTQSNGPLELITADYYGADDEHAAGIRGYARLDAKRFEALGTVAPGFSVLVGVGVVAITIE